MPVNSRGGRKPKYTAASAGKFKAKPEAPGKAGPSMTRAKGAIVRKNLTGSASSKRPNTGTTTYKTPTGRSDKPAAMMKPMMKPAAMTKAAMKTTKMGAGTHMSAGGHKSYLTDAAARDIKKGFSTANVNARKKRAMNKAAGKKPTANGPRPIGMKKR